MRDISVELAGHTVRLVELRAHPQRYSAWFTRARRWPGHARCLCSRTGERLVIRAIAGSYHLARWPQTGDNHHPGCPFFTTDSRHSGAGEARAAITVTEYGTRIAVDYTFSTDLPAGDDTSANSPAGPVDETIAGARPHGASVTGLGLLHWLWEASGLNTWPDPTPAGAGTTRARHRGWSEVHAALLPTLAGLRLGEQPAPLLLHVVAPYRPRQPDPAREARLTEFLRPLEHPGHITIRSGPNRGRRRLRRHRRLLLAELKDLAATEHGHKLALRHFPRPIFLTTEHQAHLQHRFPAVFSARSAPRARRVVLALVEGTSHGNLRLVDAAVLLTSGDYLPADSSHEVAMAQWLVDAGREFTKPLRYGGDATHPDFVLTDTDPATIVEVHGITGRADYETRKQAKNEHYVREGVPVIAWDVNEPPPPVSIRHVVE